MGGVFAQEVGVEAFGAEDEEDIYWWVLVFVHSKKQCTESIDMGSRGWKGC